MRRAAPESIVSASCRDSNERVLVGMVLPRFAKAIFLLAMPGVKITRGKRQETLWRKDD